MLTTTTSNLPADVKEFLTNEWAWLPLIVSIVYEYLRGAASPWHSYFNVLPTTFDSLMFWSKTELETLQASAVTSKIGRDQAEETWRATIIPLMLAWSHYFPVVGQNDAEKTTELIKLAHMAGSLIMAYAFDIDRGDGKKENDNVSEDEFEEDDEDEPLKGMVPFADMLNADADLNNVGTLSRLLHYGILTCMPMQARLFQETDYLIMKSTRPIKAGEQIFNDYGPLPRSDLLRMYGYTTENYSRYDVVELSHDLFLEVVGKMHGAQKAAWRKREEQLEELGVLDDGYAIPRPAKDVSKLEDALPGQIHMLLRALCGEAAGSPKDAITIKEVALLQAVLMKRLTEYGTSLKADAAALQALSENETPATLIAVNCKTHRYRMALQVRIGEKEILHQLITLCQEGIAAKTKEMASGSKKRPLSSGSDSTPKKAARRENVR